MTGMLKQLERIRAMDLLPHVGFDIERCTGYARRVNPQIECLVRSARTGEGLEGWYRWLRLAGFAERIR